MKILNLVAALSLSSIGFGQYFNVYPEFAELDSNSNTLLHNRYSEFSFLRRIFKNN